jgi:hypothetical protein
MQVVFNHDRDACAPDDVPDDGARAFRDFEGQVHLIASGFKNRAMIGPNLNSVKRNCAIIYQDGQSADPSRFDDDGWLESFYTLDGRTVQALVSHDYHPGRHHLRCGSSKADQDGCWYSDIITATSRNGGRNFTSPPPGPARFIAGAPYRFDPDHVAPVGVLVVSNIVAFENAYYVFVSTAADGAQKGGSCLLRTANPEVPSGWRAWDGHGFNVQFIDPWTTPVYSPEKHVCEPVAPAQLTWAVRSLLALAGGRGFVVTMDGAVNKPNGVHTPVIATSASADLLHWSKPEVAEEFEPHDAVCTPTSKHTTIYGYTSLLDPASPGRNFETVGDTAFFYMLRYQRCGGLRRDLVRQPVTIRVEP